MNANDAFADFILSNPVLANSAELLFYGGSFNPWHQGHSACVKLAPQNIPLIVIPDHNPQKEVSMGEGKAESLKIIHAIAARRKNTFCYEGFLKTQKRNPTSAWVSHLKERAPSKRLALLMGFDSFVSLPLWINSQKLLKDLDTVYVASRNENEELRLRALQAASAASGLTVRYLGGHPYEDVSSTKLRHEHECGRKAVGL